MATFVDGIRRWARAGIRRSEPAIGLALEADSRGGSHTWVSCGSSKSGGFPSA